MEIQNIDLFIRGMIAHDAGHPHFIRHFLKGHEFARLIGIGENLGKSQRLRWRLLRLSMTSGF